LLDFLDVKNQDIYIYIFIFVYIYFRPRKSDTPLDSEYLQALEFGREYYDCSQIYKSCLSGQGVLDQISKTI